MFQVSVFLSFHRRRSFVDLIYDKERRADGASMNDPGYGKDIGKDILEESYVRLKNAAKRCV